MIEIDLRVNKDHICHITAHRQDNFVSVSEPSVYEWEANFYPCPTDPVAARSKMYDPGPPIIKSGIVRHAYKDGAPVLALKVLQELERKK